MASSALECIGHPDLYFCKAMFALGAGQTEGLRYEGLKERVLTVLGPKPFAHAALLPHEDQESTPEELAEEVAAIKVLHEGGDVPLPLDTTMAVVRRREAGRSLLTLISPVKVDEATLAHIRSLGEVAEIVCPSLQHWVFCEDLVAHFPEARVLWAPPACGEDCAVKMPALAGRAEVLVNGFSQLGEELEARLLEGAPLNMNEFLFHHAPSKTLVVSDAFYGGHTQKETTWFQRLWFKLTKGGSFRACRLPVYRTSRVKTHGSVPALLACVDGMVDDWGFEKIVFAHGTNPYTQDASASFRRSWRALENEEASTAHVHAIKPVEAPVAAASVAAHA